MEADKTTGGLFPECFRHNEGRSGHHVIRDLADGVDRCPECAWEMEDGVCPDCGFPGFFSDESEDEYNSLDGSMVAEVQNAWGRPEGMSAANFNSSEDDDSDESDFGSMEGFVVNDLHRGRPSPRISSNSEFDSDDSSSSTSSVPAPRPPFSVTINYGVDPYAPPEPESSLDDSDEQYHGMESDNAESYGGFLQGRRYEDASASETTTSEVDEESSDEEDDDDAEEDSTVPEGRSSGDETPTPRTHNQNHTHRSRITRVVDDSDSEPAPAATSQRGIVGRNSLQQRRRTQPSPPTFVNISSESEESDVPQDYTNVEAPHVVASATSGIRLRLREPNHHDHHHNQPSRPAQSTNNTSQRVAHMPGAFPPSFTFSEQENSQLPVADVDGAQDRQQTSQVPSRSRPNPTANRRSVPSSSRAAQVEAQANERDAASSVRRANRMRQKVNLNARRLAAQGSATSPAVISS